MSTLGEAKAREKQQTAGRLLIRGLVQQNVKYIFGIPGGKIMPTFDVLRDEGPQLIARRSRGGYSDGLQQERGNRRTRDSRVEF